MKNGIKFNIFTLIKKTKMPDRVIPKFSRKDSQEFFQTLNKRVINILKIIKSRKQETGGFTPKRS